MSLRTRGWRRDAVAGFASVLSISAIVGLQLANPRVLASWHGFLHAGIVERIRLTGIPPENPFFAGEPLPYYWVWHAVAEAFSSASNIDALASFQFLTLTSLALLWFASIHIGVSRWGSGRDGLMAGLLIGWLALAGSAPLGPLLALARSLVDGIALFESAPAAVETIRVSDAVADQWMTHPMIGALFWSWDWRLGPNAIWFWDNSSRAASLVALLMLAGQTLPERLRLRGLIATTLLAASIAALNPLIGVGAGLSLAGAAVVVGFLRSEAKRFRFAAAVGLGLALAAPSYLHILGGGGSGVTIRFAFLGALLAISFAMAPIWLVAVGGALRAAEAKQHGDSTLLLAATVLLGVGVVLHLAEGNEHNLVNAALVVLAIPAAHWAASDSRRSIGLALVFAPILIACFLAFSGRPALPLTHVGTSLQRSDGLEAVYRYLREETAPDAVLVDDPDRPLRMAGNVSELPAFTGRALLTGHPSYLTRDFADAETRAGIARKLLAGERLETNEQALIRDLGRPVYLLRTDRGASDKVPVVFEAHGIAIQRVQ